MGFRDLVFPNAALRAGSGEGSEKVPEKVPEKVLEKVPEKVWEALVQSQVRFNRICGHLIDGNLAEVFPALGVAARFRKICKNKSLRLLGIPLKLIFYGMAAVSFSGAYIAIDTIFVPWTNFEV